MDLGNYWMQEENNQNIVEGDDVMNSSSFDLVDDLI